MITVPWRSWLQYTRVTIAGCAGAHQLCGVHLTCEVFPRRYKEKSTKLFALFFKEISARNGTKTRTKDEKKREKWALHVHTSLHERMNPTQDILRNQAECPQIAHQIFHFLPVGEIKPQGRPMRPSRVMKLYTWYGSSKRTCGCFLCMSCGGCILLC